MSNDTGSVGCPGQSEIPGIPTGVQSGVSHDLYQSGLGSLPIIKDLFTSIITKLEILAVHIEDIVKKQCAECHRKSGHKMDCETYPQENDCNS